MCAYVSVFTVEKSDSFFRQAVDSDLLSMGDTDEDGSASLSKCWEQGGWYESPGHPSNGQSLKTGVITGNAALG